MSLVIPLNMFQVNFECLAERMVSIRLGTKKCWKKFSVRPVGEEIEVCSGWVKNGPNLMTVDINPERNPVHVGDGQSLPTEWNNRFDRWYCDPPYNERNAKIMYGTQLPSWSKLLTEGARVTKPGGLLFLLLGSRRND